MDGFEDDSGSFSRFVDVCDRIASEGSYTGKVRILKEFFATFSGDVYTFCKLMLCRNDITRIYNGTDVVTKDEILTARLVFMQLKKKQLVKILSRVLRCDQEEMLDHYRTGGDIAETSRLFFRLHGNPAARSSLTQKDVDRWLDEHGNATKEDDQAALYAKLLPRCTPKDFATIVLLVQKDLKINVGPKYVLGALHPSAYEAFMRTNDLKVIVEKVINHQLQDVADGKKKKGFDTGLTVLHPIKPMLARPLKSIQDCAKRCPNGVLAEIKYDGERIQIHKAARRNAPRSPHMWMKYFSRNLKPIMEWKVEAVESYIPLATPSAEHIILDGEILLVDTNTGNPLPFGSLGVHKQRGYADATVCIFVFDIIMLNGKSLLDTPIKERRRLLEEHLTVVPHRVELSEARVVQRESIEEELAEMMAKAMREKLEGLVLKPLQTLYTPNARHWLKFKKDYLEGMGDSADLVLLGGYWGTGAKGGILSKFLMGAFDTDANVWKTVCKVGNGFDDHQLVTMQEDVKSIMTEVFQDYSRCPSWLDVKKHMMPDWLVTDPMSCPVWEIMGAEFTCTHGTHTGPSIRFPRVIRIRDDKDFESHTNHRQLIEMMEAEGSGDAAKLLKARPAKGVKCSPIKFPSSSPTKSPERPTRRSRSPSPAPRAPQALQRRKRSRQPDIRDLLASPRATKRGINEGLVALPPWPDDASEITLKVPPRAARSAPPMVFGKSASERQKNAAALPLSDVVAAVSHLAHASVEDSIVELGGRTSLSFSHVSVTHIVLCTEKGTELPRPYNLAANIVREDWVADCYNENTLIDEAPYSIRHLGPPRESPRNTTRGLQAASPLLAMFTPVRCALLKFSKPVKEQLTRYIVAYDGEVEDPSGETSHVVTDSWSTALDKTLASLPAVPVVTSAWVWDCVNAGMLLDHSKYRLPTV